MIECNVRQCVDAIMHGYQWATPPSTLSSEAFSKQATVKQPHDTFSGHSVAHRIEG